MLYQQQEALRDQQASLGARVAGRGEAQAASPWQAAPCHHALPETTADLHSSLEAAQEGTPALEAEHCHETQAGAHILEWLRCLVAGLVDDSIDPAAKRLLATLPT